MNRNFIYAMIFSSIISILISCKKDNLESSDHESINRLILQLSSSNDTALFQFDDLDGEGGLPPIIISPNLKTNTSYRGQLKLFNLNKGTYTDITPTIYEEGDAHQFFYIFQKNQANTSYLDADKNGLPIGINTTWTTLNSGQDTLRLVLRHEPNKSGLLVSQGDITNAGGDTDVEINFPFNIQ